jgi:hypothetical protein
MPFKVKNGPPTYHRVVSKFFKDYLNKLLKIFLDDFIVYSDMELICRNSDYVFKSAGSLGLIWTQINVFL